MTTKEKFIEMAKNITVPASMMAWLETTDFYEEAPASTKFHGSQAGGLCALLYHRCKSGWWSLQTSMCPASTRWMNS